MSLFLTIAAAGAAAGGYAFLTDSIAGISVAAGCFSAATIILEYARHRRVRLIHVWHMAFIYILVSEMVLDYGGALTMHPYGLAASRFLFLANILVTVAYYANWRGRRKPYSAVNETLPRLRSNVFLLLCILFAAFLAYAAPTAMQAASAGRAIDFAPRSLIDLVAGPLLLGLGMLLPSAASQYITAAPRRRAQVVVLYIAIATVFLAFLAIGTRYYLLFSAGGFLAAHFRSVIIGRNKNGIIALLLGGALIMGGADTALEYRTRGYAAQTVQAQGADTFLQSAARKMSPEGVVRLNADLLAYFDGRPHLYGASSGFLLYFWIPRALWPDKPPMIGYWLIREFESGFSDGHSASVGFFGDLYADFGLGAFICMLALGTLLRRLDDLAFSIIATAKSELILATMTYPAVFFFMRSPVTAAINFIAFYLIFKIYAFFAFKRERSAHASQTQQNALGQHT